jgi:DNA-binding NarL/FixJ family response regulator
MPSPSLDNPGVEPLIQGMMDVLCKTDMSLSMPRVRVLVADDHEAMRDRVVCMLSKDCHVLGAVGDGESLVEAARCLEPDLLVIDVSMPILGGIEAAIRLRNMGSTARIVFLTIHEDDACIRACVAAGGLGYVIKSRLAGDLPIAISNAMAGRPYVSPCLAPVYPSSEARH